MQMSEEGASEFFLTETRFSSSADHPGSEINYVRCIVYYHCKSRSPPFGIGIWCTGTEENDLGFSSFIISLSHFKTFRFQLSPEFKGYLGYVLPVLAGILKGFLVRCTLTGRSVVSCGIHGVTHDYHAVDEHCLDD